MSKIFSKEEVASHSKGESLYIVIDEDVYDVSKFQDEHPGKCSALPTSCATWPRGDATTMQVSHVLTELVNRWKEEYVIVPTRCSTCSILTFA